MCSLNEEKGEKNKPTLNKRHNSKPRRFQSGKVGGISRAYGQVYSNGDEVK